MSDVPGPRFRPQTPGVPDHAAPAPPWVARVRKFLVAVAGLLAQVIASGALDGNDDVRVWVQAVLAVLTAAGVYAVPNARAAR